MKTYYVLWTYAANYSDLLTVRAESATDAYERATAIYGSKFHAEATVLVFDTPPAYLRIKGNEVCK